MDAIITAGGIPKPDEPLYSYTQGGFKVMLDIGGKPIIQWLLDVLSASAKIDRIVIVGLPPVTDLVCSHPITILDNQGELLANISAACAEVLREKPDAKSVLLVSGDLPGVNVEMVDWMIDRICESEHDFYYSVVERDVMEKRYPGSRRTYVHLKDHELCGGDMLGLNPHILYDEKAAWQKMIASRKNPIQQASIIGFDTLLLLLLRQLTLKEAEKTVSHRLGVNGRVIITPYAEMGMDVDKPFQLEMMREDLIRRMKSE